MCVLNDDIVYPVISNNTHSILALSPARSFTEHWRKFSNQIIATPVSYLRATSAVYGINALRLNPLRLTSIMSSKKEDTADSSSSATNTASEDSINKDYEIINAEDASSEGDGETPKVGDSWVCCSCEGTLESINVFCGCLHWKCKNCIECVE